MQYANYLRSENPDDLLGRIEKRFGQPLVNHLGLPEGTVTNFFRLQLGMH